MLRPDTIKIQKDMAMYCRSGKMQDIPGITEGRLPHYRRLVLNVVHGTITQAYPITRKVLSEKEWDYIFNNFFIEHDAQTPILWKLPYKFYLYVKDNNYDDEFNKPWLSELLWFEWLEIEVYMMPDENHGNYSESGDILNDLPVLNKDSRLIKLKYPIHLYPVEEVEKNKRDYYIFIYREQDSGTVRFVNLSVLYAFLFDNMLQDTTVPVVRLLPELAKALNLQEPETMKMQIEKFLKNMLNAGAILGFRKK